MSVIAQNLINELIGFGHPTGEQAYSAWSEKEIYDSVTDDYITFTNEQLPFQIVQVNDYNQDVREALNDSYSSVTINLVIKYKDLFFKSEAEMGSYTDDWSDWQHVNLKVKMVEYYE